MIFKIFRQRFKNVIVFKMKPIKTNLMKATYLISKLGITLVLIGTIFISCKKDKLDINETNPDNYSSMSAFFNTNGVKSEFFSFQDSAGGTFTSAKGTKITVLPNSFIDASSNVVTGIVTLEFKDIYDKSDMILSDKPTNTQWGILKSGGEFFVRVKQNAETLNLAPGKSITFEQPLNGLPLDSVMLPFVLGNDSAGLPAWNWTSTDSINYTATSYIYSMYNFNSPIDSGTWCNSDDPYFFQAYSQTSLTIHPTDNPTQYNTNVFIIFSGINAMIHVYLDSPSMDFIYNYAPIGLDCSVVAIGVKEGKLYYDIKNTTISANSTVNVSLSEITTEALIAKLVALNN